MIKKYFVFLLALIPIAVYAANDIVQGKVVNVDGTPEACVWVIAETEELPTHYRKIVVTDDEGNFVLPEMPKATYDIWVRGYGLSDSKKNKAKLGDTLSLRVEDAKTATAAAAAYPANYWMSMIEAPSKEALKKSKFGDVYKTPDDWLSQFKHDCNFCHQLGSVRTRFPNVELYDYGLKKSATMNHVAQQLDRELVLSVLDKWAKRMSAGEVPREAPPRPTGIERNFVITQWEWGAEYSYAHDEVSTDKRNPFLYPDGPIYGVDLNLDKLLIVDPIAHTTSSVDIPAGENTEDWCNNTYKPLGSDEILPFSAKILGCPEPGIYSPYEGVIDNPVNAHNPMMDAKGRVWMTMQVRREWGEDLPEFCKKDPVIANNPHHRQIGYYDTKTKEIVQIDSCFGTHHLQFDDNEVLWFSGDGHVVGWLDTKIYDHKDPKSLEKAMGWSEGKVDSDGDGTGDTSIYGFRYGIIHNSVDDSIWIGMPPGGLYPPGGRGYILRYDPKTGLGEAYAPPAPGYASRSVEVDSEGNIWTGLSGSGHLAKFERSKCKQTWGTGDQCPEGWTLWKTPGPTFKGLKEVDNAGSADRHYYIWMDNFNTLGMGKGTVMLNGTASDSLLAFRPDTETFTKIRIPYPLVSYTRGLDGRIDDEKGGWKGRGLWFTNGLDPIMQSEVPRSYVGHVQLRPSPTSH